MALYSTATIIAVERVMANSSSHRIVSYTSKVRKKS
jgi:hypothetical protein